MMQNKKVYIILGLAIFLIGIAAFVAGRMLNGKVGNVGLGGPNSQTFVSVWGRRSGDRVVADVLFYSNPQSIKKPGT
jgi:hypothetical protein